MNINKPDEDIDKEILKMQFIDSINNPNMTSEHLIAKFGFKFVRDFTQKLSIIPPSHAAISMKDTADKILLELYIIKPIGEYPELWI